MHDHVDHVCALDVRAPDPARGTRTGRPHLLRDSAGAVPHYTPHSLKKAKISAYVGLRLHCDYLCSGWSLARMLARRSNACQSTAHMTLHVQYARAA